MWKLQLVALWAHLFTIPFSALRGSILPFTKFVIIYLQIYCGPSAACLQLASCQLNAAENLLEGKCHESNSPHSVVYPAIYLSLAYFFPLCLLIIFFFLFPISSSFSFPFVFPHCLSTLLSLGAFPSVPYLYSFDTDPDPRIHIIKLRIRTQIQIRILLFFKI